MERRKDRSRWLDVLSWGMYGLAAIILGAAILIGLSVSGAAAVVPAATIGFQSPALRPLWDALVTGLHQLGALVFAAGFVVAVLVFSIALLVGQLTRLSRRLDALERLSGAGAYQNPAPEPGKTLPASIELPSAA